MQTRITKLLEIEYPVIQGGMAWVANAALAANVSKAGGIGFIGAANAPAEWVRSEIRRAKEITDKPIGVNVMLLSEHVDEVAQVVAEEGVKAVTTGAGNPAKYMKQWKEAGIRVIPVVASVAMARMMERAQMRLLQRAWSPAVISVSRQQCPCSHRLSMRYRFRLSVQAALVTAEAWQRH